MCSVRSRVVTLIGLVVTLACLAPVLHAATVSGVVTIPASPTGWAPDRAEMQVRVQGTALSAPVDAGSGAFTLTDVPAGTVTLMLVERSGYDTFTQASKRAVVSVTGDVTDAAFNLQYHWQQLAGYPPVWGTAGYDTWETFFVSDQVGFVLFRITGSPERVEIYGTGDGGASWAQVEQFIKDDAQYAAGNQTFPSSELKMFWGDATHGVILASRPCLPCGCNTGFLRTDNGGATWTVVDLPLVQTAYNVNVDRFARISSTHWIAAGWIGCNVQGYGSGFHNVIWETTDSGANWQVADAYEGGDGCTGLAANSDGDAICFRTPYGGGVRNVSRRSGSTGTWSTAGDGSIVLNSGYGPGDVVMIGDTTWVGSSGGSLPNGLYRSTQAGAAGTWTKVSDSAVQYLAYGTSLKAFGLFGGPAHVSYDGGATWLYQSGGGGLCCHGNDIFGFDAVHAIWRDRGVGDPDGVSSIFSYYEPWLANFEVLAGTTIPNGYARAGEANVPLAAYTLRSHGPVPVQVNAFTLDASGEGNEATDIAAVRLWLDADKDGLVGAGDTQLGQDAYALNDGTVVLSTGGGLTLTQLVPVQVLVTYDLASAAATGGTFTCSLAASNVNAETADTHQPLAATAPAGQTTPGRTITTAQLVLSDDFENGLGAWLATTEDPQPDAGYGWKLSGDISASPSHSAYIHEDRNHDGWASRHYLTLASPIDLSAAGTYQLAFNEWYALEPSPLLHVQSSVNGGQTWQTIRTFGNWETNLSGAYLQKVYDLPDLAGQSSVLLRFQLDWTSGWYFNATWSVDDVRVYRLPPPQDPDDEPTDPIDPPGGGTGGTTNPPPDDQTETPGEGEPQDDQVLADEPPPAFGPVCGFGMIEAGLATMLVLLVTRRRG